MYTPFLNRKFNSFLEYYLPSRADYVIAASWYLYYLFKRRVNDISYLPNGIDPSVFNPRKTRKIIIPQLEGKKLLSIWECSIGMSAMLIYSSKL